MVAGYPGSYARTTTAPGPTEPGRRSLRPAGEQGEGVRQAPIPRRGGDAARTPEWFQRFTQVQDLHAGRRHGGDDLAEGPLPFHCSASRERIVDVAAAEVAAVLPDARQVLIPRPQGHRRMRLVDEQVPRGPAPGPVSGPGTAMVHRTRAGPGHSARTTTACSSRSGTSFCANFQTAA